MKIKTSEATKLQLDWGVAVAMQVEKLKLVEGRPVYMPSCGGRKPFDHTDPAVCMGLIKQYKPDVVYRAEQWGVEFPHNNKIP